MKGIDPTGREVTWQESMFFRFGEAGGAADAKVEEIWHIVNVMEILGKLGVLPSERLQARIQQVGKVFTKLGKLTRLGRGGSNT